MSDMNIYQRMAAVTRDLQTVAKNLTVETTKGKGYKAVSERDIIDAVKPLEDKYGIYSFPAGRELLESSMLESENTYNGNTTKKTTFFSRIQTTYRFVNIDKPDEYIDTTTFAEGIDTQDKGSGKAMTYGDKYALMKAYKISTGDDPDQTASQDEDYSRRGEKPKTISEDDADHIIKGLAFIVGTKLADQKALLYSVSEGYSDVYALPPELAPKVLAQLRQMAREKAADAKNEGAAPSEN